MKTTYYIISSLIILLLSQTVLAGRAPLKTVAADPYASAYVFDADTGATLFEKNADAAVYPASTLKLMVLLVILDRIDQGILQLDDMVQVSVEAYRMGGSQVYLDPKEQFPLEELLYALMIQSANDAAVALASHVAGTKEEFVVLMNKKATELGMRNTRFYSVHGLPPAKGQQVDVTTARDFGILCRTLSKRPEVFQYTGTRVRDFRDGEFIMRTHNHLLGKVDGCDGFKTGYFTKAGFSIAATAKKGGVRIIAIVMGSQNRKVRDAKSIELLAQGFTKVPPRPEPIVTSTAIQADIKKGVDSPPSDGKTTLSVPESDDQAATESSGWGKFFMGTGFGFLLYRALDFFLFQKRSKRSWHGRKR